jgi:hypothetical protein
LGIAARIASTPAFKRQGDVIEIAGKSGVVEDVTLRHVRVRDFDGHVHVVPNGEINDVDASRTSFVEAGWPRAAAPAPIAGMSVEERDVHPLRRTVRRQRVSVRY